MRQRWCTIVFLLLLAAMPAQAATWYVTQAGAGSANGTSLANAWSAAAFNTAANWGGGASDIMPDDTVLLNGTITTALNMQGSGTSGSPIVIDGTSVTMNVSGLTSAQAQIGINGKNYITVQNVTFNPAIASGTLIRMGNTSGTTANVTNITLQNNSFVASGTNTVQALHIKACANCLIAGNTFDNLQAGISGDTTNIHDVIVRNNLLRLHTGTDDVNQRDLIRLGDAYNMTFEGNKLVVRGAGNTQHNDVIQNFQSGATPNAAPYDWIIRHNWIELDTTATNNRSWLMIQSMTGSLKIYGNIFLGTDGGESANGAAVTRNNTGFTMHMYHNTFYSISGPNQLINIGDTGTFNVINNVVYDIDAAGTVLDNAAATVFTHQYNSYNGGNATSGYDGTSCATFKHSTEVCGQNPLFTNAGASDFSLQGTSPLIGAGIIIAAEYNLKLAPGASFPNPDLISVASGTIGAFEYVDAGTDELVGHWPLDDGTGSSTADDISGNLNDGTLSGVNTSTAWVSGVTGGALEFDGDAYVDMGDILETDFPAAQDFTVLVYVRTTTAPSSGHYAQLVSKVDNDGTRHDWGIIRAPSDAACAPTCQWFGEVHVGGTGYTCTSNSTIHNGLWHRLALVRRGEDLECWHDGVLVDTETNVALDGSVENAYPLRLGRSNFGTPFEYYFTGTLDDVRIYNYALLQSEIEALSSLPILGRAGGKSRLRGKVRFR